MELNKWLGRPSITAIGYILTVRKSPEACEPFLRIYNSRSKIKLKIAIDSVVSINGS